MKALRRLPNLLVHLRGEMVSTMTSRPGRYYSITCPPSARFRRGEDAGKAREMLDRYCTREIP